MRKASNPIHSRKTRGGESLEEETPIEEKTLSEEAEEKPIEETTQPLEEQVEEAEEITEEPTEAVEEKIGIEPVQEEAVVLKPSKRSFRTIRKRKKIGEELIEKEIEEQQVRIKDQINELPKERRKAFLEELLESMNK